MEFLFQETQTTSLNMAITNPLAPHLSPKTSVDGLTLFSNTIGTVIGWLFLSGILIFVLFFLINAIKYIASQGDKASIESARNGLLQALVGLVVLFSLFAILKTLQLVFGVCLLQLPIPVLGQPTIGGDCSDPGIPRLLSPPSG